MVNLNQPRLQCIVDEHVEPQNLETVVDVGNMRTHTTEQNIFNWQDGFNYEIVDALEKLACFHMPNIEFEEVSQSC